MAGEWTVLVYRPGESASEATAYIDPVLKVDLQPEHTALWDANIKLAPVLAPDEYRFGKADIYHDGDFELGVDIEDTGTADDGTVTLGGRERRGGSLTDEVIQRTFADQSYVSAIRSVWDQDTAFDATVHPPTSGRISDLLVQQGNDPNELSATATARPRDDQGRFVATETGTAPDFLPTEPVRVSDTAPAGIQLKQTCWTREAESWDRQTRASTTTLDRASANEAAVLDRDGSEIEFDFHTDYEIPSGEFGFTVRSFATFDSTQYPGDRLKYFLDGEQFADRLLFNNVRVTDNDYLWTAMAVHNDSVDPGNHTVTIAKTNTSASWNIDAVAPMDTRFNHGPPGSDGSASSFDNDLTDRERLESPRLYPPEYDIFFDWIHVGFPIDTVDVTGTWSDAYQPTDAIVVTDDDGEQRQSIDTVGGGTTQTRSFGVTQTARVRAGASVERAGDDTTRTPTRGYRSTTFQGIEVRVSGDEESWIDSREMDGSPFEILQTLHKDGNYHWSIDHGRADGAYVAESFERGDPDLARALPPEAVATGVDQDSSTEGYHNRVVVIGAKRPEALRREGEPVDYRGVAEDSQEISANGVQSIKIHDESLETDGDCLSKARTELRKGLAADQQGGSIDTTPALVEPGYPYRVPHLASEDPHAPRLGTAETIDRSAWTTLSDVAGGESVTVGPSTSFGQYGWARSDITIDGSVTIASDGRVKIAPEHSIAVSDTGSLTVENGGFLTTDADSVLFGSVTIGPGEPFGRYAEVWGDAKVVGDLTIADGGHVFVLPGASLETAANGSITTQAGGTLEDPGGGLPTRTLETWSLSESAGDASASGAFERPGGLGGTDSAALLGLLAGD